MVVVYVKRSEQSKNFFHCALQYWQFRRLSAIAGFMLSVLIETRNDEDALARTLASLVGAAVEGLVREVIVCDAGSTDQTHKVADHAGCHFLTRAPLANAVRQAKGDWLLLIEPGARLDGEWMGAVVAHLSQTTQPARFTRARGSGRPFLSRVFTRRNPLADGVVINKAQALSRAASGASARAMVRGLSMKRLKAEIQAAPHR